MENRTEKDMDHKMKAEFIQGLIWIMPCRTTHGCLKPLIALSFLLELVHIGGPQYSYGTYVECSLKKLFFPSPPEPSSFLHRPI